MRTPILALTVLLIGACASPPEKTPSRPNAQRLPNAKGLTNAARITPNLYRGAQPNNNGYDTLNEMGVKTVISFRRFTSSKKSAEDAGLQYLSIPIYASIGSSPPTLARSSCSSIPSSTQITNRSTSTAGAARTAPG